MQTVPVQSGDVLERSSYTTRGPGTQQQQQQQRTSIRQWVLTETPMENIIKNLTIYTHLFPLFLRHLSRCCNHPLAATLHVRAKHQDHLDTLWYTGIDFDRFKGELLLEAR